MNFDKLEIERELWGKDKGMLSGKIAFSNELGKVTLKLNQKHIDMIFNVVADSLVDVAKMAGEEMTCKILEHKSELEVKDD